MRTLPPSLLRHLSRGVRRALLVGEDAVDVPRWAISATPYGGAIVSVSAAVVSVNLLVVLFVVLRRCGADTGEVRRPSEAAPLSGERIRGSVPAAEQRRYGESGGLQCAVCLCRLRQPEALRLLSGCGHIFHVECADRWLEGRSSCPLCRHEVHREGVHLAVLCQGLLTRVEPPPPDVDATGILPGNVGPTTLPITHPSNSEPNQAESAGAAGRLGDRLDEQLLSDQTLLARAGALSYAIAATEIRAE
ncbi:unnamed protein product [Spirodela intermedia]|uniref:RING-type domain-containing protein n=1 Tax=Spirodela intermedia TaxID=51605 RepID=A0A7I8LCL2_SPIIN|nr:unnamed protein product [Spirodela intermedia]